MDAWCVFLGSSSGLTAVIRCVSLRPVWRSADDPQLAEFLRLMQPRRAGAIWSNEDAELAKQSSQAAAPKPRAAGKQQAGGRVAAGSGAALQPTEHGVPAGRSRAAAAQPHHRAAEGEEGCQACTGPRLVESTQQALSTTD